MNDHLQRRLIADSLALSDLASLGWIDGQGQLQYYTAGDDADDLDFRAHISILKEHLRQLSESGRIQAAGICVDVILHNEINHSQEAIQCSLVHADGEAIERFTPYSKTGSGAVSYGESFTAGRNREIFGFARSVLTLENQPPVLSPTLTQLGAAVDSLTLQGGPGFLILEGATEDYTQAAGGDDKLTVEWREYSNGGFRHWVAGSIGGAANEDIAKIETNGCVVTVLKNEVLTSEEVKTILEAFARGQGKPTQYRWRDMTARFVDSRPGAVQE
jgi:hypothetical protein